MCPENKNKVLPGITCCYTPFLHPGHEDRTSVGASQLISLHTPARQTLAETKQLPSRSTKPYARAQPVGVFPVLFQHDSVLQNTPPRTPCVQQSIVGGLTTCSYLVSHRKTSLSSHYSLLYCVVSANFFARPREGKRRVLKKGERRESARECERTPSNKTN